jgi:hypothetical protein
MEPKTHYGGGMLPIGKNRYEDEFEDDYDFRTRGRRRT